MRGGEAAKKRGGGRDVAGCEGQRWWVIFEVLRVASCGARILSHGAKWDGRHVAWRGRALKPLNSGWYLNGFLASLKVRMYSLL